MRILITTFTYAPEANGVAEVVGAQAAGLAQLGHEVTIATGFVPARASLSTTANPRVIEFKVSAAGAPGSGIGEDIERYQQFVREADADAILCHCWQTWPTDLATPALAAHRAKKVIVSHGFSAHRWLRHGRPPWGLRAWWRARPYVRALPWMLQQFDHVVFLSETVNRDRFYDHWILERHGGPAWSVIPNGCWPEKFLHSGDSFREEHGIGDAFMLLYVGLFTRNKNQEGAVRAFMDATLEDAVLVLIGNEFNDYARNVQQLAQRLSKGHSRKRVIFLEHQSREAIRAAYRTMDLFLMTSKYETQPLVLLDAMACGKPFVSTAVGCVAELPGGMVVRTQRGLVASLGQLHADAALRSELGRRGMEAVKTTYNWERVIAAYDALLQKLVA